MYCSTCGVAVAKGLSYCNYCGAQLIGPQVDPSHLQTVRPELVVSAMAALFILGLFAIAVLIGVGKAGAGFDLPILLAITTVSFVMLMIIEGVLIHLLLRSKREPKKVSNTNGVKDHTTRELQEAQARMLPEPVASVTENTTRAFDPIPVERKSK
ncbi:MAG TPA: hypothetical protein VJU86_03475 [Pyrinomonadaceae bacterium]|nr:hypothetical protein [Pyrinomonadaceae bacterium]